MRVCFTGSKRFHLEVYLVYGREGRRGSKGGGARGEERRERFTVWRCVNE